jgi:mono/diheme cytochrome c family protein
MTSMNALAAFLAAFGALAIVAACALRWKALLVRYAWASLAGLAVLACLTPAVLMAVGLSKSHARRAPVPNIKVAATSEQIRRGQAIASGFCGACHSSSGAMTGGRDLGEHLPAPLGHFIAANLTPTGPLSRWSDGQIFRAIRNSIDADGVWLTIMSLTNASRLSDQDIQAVIAYLRSLPADGRPTPDLPDRLSPLGLILLGVGKLPAGHPVFTGAIMAPSKAATAEYGEYILSYHDCRDCHGADLQGGVPGQFGPIGPALTIVKDWKLEDFIATLRTGIAPNGYHLDGDKMPWRSIGSMDDEELGAIYAYLKRLPDPER